MAMRMILVVALAAVACTDSPPPTIEGQRALPQREWLRAALRTLRKESCSEGGLVRRCSDTDRDECERTITAALRQCVDAGRDRFPDSIADGEEDQRLHDELRGCMWHHAAFALGPARLDMPCLLTPRARGG